MLIRALFQVSGFPITVQSFDQMVPAVQPCPVVMLVRVYELSSTSLRSDIYNETFESFGPALLVIYP